MLAAHSIGGIIARQFAARHPGNVAGMVLVDSSHENQAHRRRDLLGWAAGRVLYLRIALSHQGRILGLRRLAAAAGRARALDADVASQVLPEHANAARAIGLSTRQRRVVVREMLMAARLRGEPPDLGSIPLGVVTAGKAFPGWVPMQEELASLSTNSTHVTAKGSGHYVRVDDRDLVFQVIRDIARKSAPRPMPGA